jgi:hypothetical protein
MARCFISYSYDYRHIMEIMRNVLRVLEFDSVDVVDEPDDQRPPHALVEKRIEEADCVLVLYGPQHQPQRGKRDFEGAKWPHEEAIFAYGKRKPLTLILHTGTKLPEFLNDLQSPARFDFWDHQSFLDNVHNILKHLMDFKRRVDLPAGHQPYRYKEVMVRYRIHTSGTLLSETWYHHVIVSQIRDSFHHSLEAGDHVAVQNLLNCISDKRYELEVGPGGNWHEISIEQDSYNDRKFEYLVRVAPPLQPGEELGYRRTFERENWFPLTTNEIQAALSRREGRPDFPPELSEGRFFGTNVDILYDADSLTMAIHFPKRVRLKCHHVVVVDFLNRLNQNPNETERCNAKEHLQVIESPASAERVLELTVPRPLFNNSYYLLYEIVE